MSLQQIVQELHAATAILKFQRYIEESAKAAGQDEEEFIVKKVKKKMEALMKRLPTDQAKALTMYRKAVGEDMWDSIRNNPSLPEMVKSWVKAETEKVVPEIITILKSVLPEKHDMTDEEMSLVLDKMTNAS